MGWWKTPDGLVLGDKPADAMTSALRSVAASRAEHGDDLPAMPKLLRSLRTALQHSGFGPGPDADEQHRGRHLVATDTAGHAVPESPGDDDPELTRMIADALRKADEDYRSALDRPPTEAEILATVRFVLGPSDQQLVRSERTNDLADITWAD